MKKIPLPKGAFTIVDDDDFDFLSQWNWFVRSGYAARNKLKSDSENEPKTISMHRVIMRVSDNVNIDHANGDKLDNRKSNLRTCTNIENKRNSKTRIDSRSGYKGVAFVKQRNRPWRATISLNNKRIFLGFFRTPEEAAKAYNKAAIEYFGEFARINSL